MNLAVPQYCSGFYCKSRAQSHPLAAGELTGRERPVRFDLRIGTGNVAGCRSQLTHRGRASSHRPPSPTKPIPRRSRLKERFERGALEMALYESHFVKNWLHRAFGRCALQMRSRRSCMRDAAIRAWLHTNAEVSVLDSQR